MVQPVVSVGQCMFTDGTVASMYGRHWGCQCDLGLVVIENSRFGWICSVWVFASHVIGLEGQGAARFGWSVCA